MKQKLLIIILLCASFTTYAQDSVLVSLADKLANKCDVAQRNYQDAIVWYEDVIGNPETSYNDSIFAAIDLGYLYLQMEADGEKGTRGKLDQFIPKSEEEFAEQVDNALRHLKITSKKTKSSRELPDQYWTDIVTEQPNGYVVDANGDVHLYSAEGLAWLISSVNGLNGQEADDFKGKRVTLEANVDMSSALWTAIAQGTINGTNPDKLRFSGTFDGNGYVIRGINLYLKPETWIDCPFSSFFGTLIGARIENVVLRHAHAEGRLFYDGKFFRDAETLETASETRPTIIDRCYVEFDEIYRNHLKPTCGLFGYNNNGIIKNCMAVVHKMDYEGNNHIPMSLFVWYNNGTIKNCASFADSLVACMGYHPGFATENSSSGVIENCYSYIGDWFGDWWPLTMPRMGICVENLGIIKNCYFNTWSYNEYGMFCDEEGVTATYAGGEVIETMNFEPTPYFQWPYWELKDSVNITSYTGFVYRTNQLDVALLDWVYSQEDSEEYNYWCGGYATFMPKKLPALCGIDIMNVHEEAVPNDFTIYPNPVKDIVRIDGVETVEIQVYNTLGQLVMTERNTNEINVEGMTKGIYLIHILDKRGVFHTERVMVAR